MTATLGESKVAMAFQKPGTPCERAWADLCDEVENPRVETIMLCLGGWDAWANRPLEYRAFTEAFNDTEEGARSQWKR